MPPPAPGGQLVFGVRWLRGHACRPFAGGSSRTACSGTRRSGASSRQALRSMLASRCGPLLHRSLLAPRPALPGLVDGSQFFGPPDDWRRPGVSDSRAYALLIPSPSARLLRCRLGSQKVRHHDGERLHVNDIRLHRARLRQRVLTDLVALRLRQDPQQLPDGAIARALIGGSRGVHEDLVHHPSDLLLGLRITEVSIRRGPPTAAALNLPCVPTGVLWSAVTDGGGWHGGDHHRRGAASELAAGG